MKEKFNCEKKERKYVNFSSDSPISEAYRILRTNIEFSNSINPIKTVLVTSSLSGEGKSTTVVNLGKVFALGETKTLIIDLDLRKPAINKILGIEEINKGISSVFQEKCTVEEAIIPTETENLSLLLCDKLPLNPAEMLLSQKLTDMIAELKEKFDLILIDSPPAAVLADAGIISRLADKTIIVVSAGKVTYQDVELAKTNLINAGADIMGIVLNNVTKKTRGYKYYNNDYYNYYRTND